MISDGIKAYISVREHADNKTFTYTIGKISPFINFDIIGLFSELNTIEYRDKDQKDIKDLWGGGNLIGGSPRVNGSKLNPDQIEKIVNDFLKKNEQN